MLQKIFSVQGTSLLPRNSALLLAFLLEVYFFFWHMAHEPSCLWCLRKMKRRCRHWGWSWSSAPCCSLSSAPGWQKAIHCTGKTHQSNVAGWTIFSWYLNLWISFGSMMRENKWCCFHLKSTQTNTIWILPLPAFGPHVELEVVRSAIETTFTSPYASELAC